MDYCFDCFNNFNIKVKAGIKNEAINERFIKGINYLYFSDK